MCQVSQNFGQWPIKQDVFQSEKIIKCRWSSNNLVDLKRPQNESQLREYLEFSPPNVFYKQNKQTNTIRVIIGK